MANWKHRIDVREEWRKAEANEITPQELAKIMAAKIRALPCFVDFGEISKIAKEFEGLSEDQGADFEDFDSVYDRLCDWGDETVVAGWPPTKNCWIATF